ncbi:MAG: helix-turn-helix transcriptional regulator [Candidatus Rokubacteria bacterium]|nr:helix-turn-helix transcriptional regulator [Candidatus Rokubacteria bacterium]
MTAVALLVRTWRERRGWSLRELGERSGVSYVTIQRIEAGTMSPTVTTLDKLATALGVTPRDFFPVERRPRAPKKGGRR